MDDGSSLHDAIAALLPRFRARLHRIKQQHGKTQLPPHSVHSILSGSRGIRSLLWDISMLDAERGILYRGHSIHDCISSMAGKASPEGMLWLFLTAQMPTPAQISDLSQNLRARARDLPRFVFRCIDSMMPEGSHPMAQLACAVTAMQSQSKFAEAYASGRVPVSELWLPAMEDCLDLIARLPILAAYIYRRIFRGKGKLRRGSELRPDLILAPSKEADRREESEPGPRSSSDMSSESQLEPRSTSDMSSESQPEPRSTSDLDIAGVGFDLDIAAAGFDLDLAAGFCKMLGFEDPAMHDMMRMYMVIHGDHEGGAASSHAVRLVGSTLSDPYLAFASGLNACAGPLHGLAIQEAFRWIKQVSEQVPNWSNDEDDDDKGLEDYVRNALDSGRIIPGFGHSLMSGIDPRYECLHDFCRAKLPEDPYFRLLSKLSNVVPRVMMAQGKVRNPWPNVDAIIGVVFNHFGLDDERFFPVVLGVARSIGALSQLVWDRALCLPLERPNSVTLDWIERYCEEEEEEKKMSLMQETSRTL